MSIIGNYYQKVMCLKNFYSLSNELMFEEGKKYVIELNGIIDSGKNYFLHYTEDLKDSFTRNY